MKTSSLITGILVAAAFSVAPAALAKTSLSKGKQICESAVKTQQPAPKSVRTDNDATRVSDALLIYTLRVKNADDSSAKLTCTVDRETASPTVAPAS